MEYLYFREMIGHSHTEEEVKAIAADFETVDEDTDEEGNDVIRPCLTRDHVPKWVEITLQRFFGDISISRPNSNGTYRVEK